MAGLPHEIRYDDYIEFHIFKSTIGGPVPNFHPYAVNRLPVRKRIDCQANFAIEVSIWWLPSGNLT